MLRKSSLTFLVCAAAVQFASAAQAAPTNRLGVYEEHKSVNCAKATGCYIFFSKLALDTKISTVSCNFWINANNPSLTGVALGSSTTGAAGTFSPAQYVNPPYAMNYGSTVTQFQFLANTQHVVPKGTFPAIQIGWNTSATAVLNCSIAGTTSALLPASTAR